MKKVLCVLLVIALVGAAAYAAIDLSGMSFEELLDLKARVDKALWASDELQKVLVPSGDYVIGDDIPAGRWTIFVSGSDSSYVHIEDEKGGYVDSYYLTNGERANVTLKDGYVIELNGQIFFTPYTGAALGFR